ncbi:MAG: hypothetical protein PHX43_01415 [Alphaproteobacteria bacterium]|nr:hypothetical protein [Alphaproteobacteria bacterium]
MCESKCVECKKFKDVGGEILIPLIKGVSAGEIYAQFSMDGKSTDPLVRAVIDNNIGHVSLVPLDPRERGRGKMSGGVCSNLLSLQTNNPKLAVNRLMYTRGVDKTRFVGINHANLLAFNA